MILKGKLTSFTFVSAGSNLNKLVSSLWPTHSWPGILKKTGLSHPQLLMIGRQLGLPFDGRPKRIIRELNSPHLEPKKNGRTEKCKRDLLNFFATNPNYDDLKRNKRLRACFSDLRYWDAPWIFANISPNLRPYLKNNPRHKRKPTINVHEGNSERPSDG